MTTATAREGGCLCGEVRYRVDGAAAPFDVAYCHCRMCQRSAGAPVMVWAEVPEGALAWTRGEPRAYRSSPGWERLFCPDCGTQLVFRNHCEGTFDINVVTLDDPAAASPAYHIWTESRLPWFEIKDELPRHREARDAQAG